ncbi:hypothetical protein LINGRAHAP2_LOCUS33640 [Linum grandiflorum]
MGTKVQCESYFPGHFQMRDISDDANSSSWPQYYGDKTFPNAQYYNNGFMPRTAAERYPGYDKDLVKRTMLEHEATFRHQLYELHRLYRIQRDLMDEVKRKELYKIRMQVVEASMPSSPSASHVTSEDARKWHIPGFPVGNSVCTRPSTSAMDNMNSPLSSVKGSSTYTSPLPFQNGSASKDVEILESRPTKARRKMFDLRLPADEYIVTEDGRPLKGVHNLSGNLQHRNLNNTMKNGFVHRDDVSLVESCPRGKTSVADLNEPVLIEETNPSVHLTAHGNTPFLAKIKGHLPHRDFQANGNGNQWLKPTCEESLPSSSSRSMQALFNRALEPPPNFDPKRNHLRDRTGLGLDIITDRSIESCHREAVIAPDLSKSWSHHSWEKPNGIVSHNSVMHPHLNSSATWSKSCSQSLSQSNGKFGDRWNCNTVSTSNHKLGSEMVNRNGYHNGNSTRLNELQFSVPPRSYGQLNRGTADFAVPENQINHGSRYMDLKPVKGVNLNVAILNGSTNKVASNPRGIEVIDLERKDDSNLSSLPWLRARTASQNEATSTVIDLNAGKSSFLATYGKTSVSQSNNPEASLNKEIECRKILGFPIFQTGHVLKKEASEVEVVENKVKHLLFDMNMPCDDNELVEKTEKPAKVSNFRCDFDLNSCVSEEEASLLPCGPDFNKKPFTGIDLEAPVAPEAEEDAEAERPLDELTKVAAEAIVEISSSAPQRSLEVSVPDPLQWFADVVSSCGDYLESKFKALSRARDGVDYFESMTLELTETTLEDYMPKPLVPEGLNLDEPGAIPATRARRGNARRGRQKRDFQRDILPGLVSLSRHEVTEDIQTFGGLMRATGHLTWQSGLARRSSTRNGCGRGRKRTVVPPLVDVSPPPPLIQQLNTVEVGMEERSIRGWGKTTRRPRRQRCPPGNLPSLPVT